MDAYELLKSNVYTKNIDEYDFSQIKVDFQKSYMDSQSYHERKAKHRNPVSVSNELLHDLNNYLLELQNRPEMRDHDYALNAYGYVNTKIKQIWEENKTMKSHYPAIEAYCTLRNKDFNTIAIHFAEYDGLSDLYDEINLEMHPIQIIDNEHTEQMYNLFVSGDKAAWEGESFVLERDRCITWTEKETQSQYDSLSEEIINSLKLFPCVFAYETPCQKAPKFGYITGIIKGSSSIAIEYEIIPVSPLMTLSDFEGMKVKLGVLDKWEMNRTHWAIKNVDLVTALKSKNFRLSNGENILSANPIVFISYSWDNEDHKEWVLKLAERLCADGVDVKLDRYEAGLGTNLPFFMEDAIKIATRIIMVFTPNYKLKADNRSGGVGYEYSIINSEFFKDIAKDTRILPIIRSGTIDSAIPSFMQQYLHLNMTDSLQFEAQYQNLLRSIYKEPVIKKPRLGKKPKFI